MSSRKNLFTVGMLCLSFAGCGSGPDDPLTGTWSNATCFGDTQQPADIQSCSTKLGFGADLTVTLTDTRQSLPATADYPRCTAVRVVKGLRYSTNGQGTVTFTGATTSTLVRRDCANPGDNQNEVPDSRDQVPAGTSRYSITDRTLSLTTGPIVGDYQRE